MAFAFGVGTLMLCVLLGYRLHKRAERRRKLRSLEVQLWAQVLRDMKRKH